MRRSQSIRLQLITKYVMLVIVMGTVILAASITLGKKALISNSTNLFTSFAEQTADTINKVIELETKHVRTVSRSVIITNPDVPMEEKLEYLRGIAYEEGYKKAAIINLQGDCVTMNGEKANVAEMPYFYNALQGECFFAAPYISKIDGGLQIAITAPIIYDGQITGVLFFSKGAREFSSIVSDIKFGETASAYVVDENGTNIINIDIQKVINGVNRIEDAKTKPEFKELGAITEKMVAGETGTGEYTINGARKFLAYAPITSKGWSVGVTAELSDMLSALNGLKLTMLMAIALMVIVMIFVSYCIANKLSKRLMEIEKEVTRMSVGDFTVSKKRHNINDEITHIGEAVDRTKASVGEMIKQLRSASTEVAQQYEHLSKATRAINEAAGKKSADDKIE